MLVSMYVHLIEYMSYLQSQKRHRMGEFFLSHWLQHGIPMFVFEGFPDVVERKSSIGLTREGIVFFHLLYWCNMSSLRLHF